MSSEYAAEFPDPTDEDIKTIRATLPPGTELRKLVLDIPEGVVILITQAPQPVWKKFVDAPAEMKNKAGLDMIYASVKFPDVDHLNALLMRWPGLDGSIGNEIGRVSGAKQTTQSVKI